MRIFLMADLEGASGVVSADQQSHPGGALYGEARRYLQSDVCAACEGALEGGAEEVIIFDMHYYGLNLDIAELPAGTRLVMGKPQKIYPFFELNRLGDVRGLFMIGYHAMAGASSGLLTHSYDHSMKSIYLNDVLVGEIGMEAAIAGTYGVPLVLLSGDARAAEEEENLINQSEKAVVKYPINEQAAVCLPLAETRSLIHEKALSAVQHIDRFQPYRVCPPYTIRVEFFHPAEAQRALRLTGARRLDEMTVGLSGESLSQLWERFIGGYQGYE